MLLEFYTEGQVLLELLVLGLAKWSKRVTSVRRFKSLPFFSRPADFGRPGLGEGHPRVRAEGPVQTKPERAGKLEEPERALRRQQRVHQAHEVDPQARAA